MWIKKFKEQSWTLKLSEEDIDTSFWPQLTEYSIWLKSTKIVLKMNQQMMCELNICFSQGTLDSEESVKKLFEILITCKE